MKRYIKSAELSDIEIIKNALKGNGIDTTTHDYQLLLWEDRGTVIDFKCPGDYLAYLSIVVQGPLSDDVIVDYVNDFFEGLENMLSQYPTLKDMYDYANFGYPPLDDEGAVAKLVNKDTGEVLFEGVDD